MNTFSELTDSAAEYLLSQAPVIATDRDRQAREYRIISDHFCKRSICYLHRHPDKSGDARQRMQARLMPRVQSEVCGFAILGTIAVAFVSWALGKLFNWLWDRWWAAEPNAQCDCAAMVLSIDLPQDEDE